MSIDKKLNDLQRFAEKFLLENYGIDFNIDITINNRLSRSLGRYVWYRSGNKLPKVEVSRKLMKYGHDDVVMGVLKHELIHYALHKLNKPYKDGQTYFENELKKHNAPSTDYYYNLGEGAIVSCNSCNNETITFNKSAMRNFNDYRTKCCKSGLTHIGDVESDGINVSKKYFVK